LGRVEIHVSQATPMQRQVQFFALLLYIQRPLNKTHIDLYVFGFYRNFLGVFGQLDIYVKEKKQLLTGRWAIIPFVSFVVNIILSPVWIAPEVTSIS